MEGKQPYMLIEVLYVPGCPNHQPAMQRLKQALRSESVAAPIQEIAVRDEATAYSLRFPGSPTVRINGVDPEPNEQQSFGLTCRLYSDGRGVPSQELLQGAVAAAKSKEAEL